MVIGVLAGTGYLVYSKMNEPYSNMNSRGAGLAATSGSQAGKIRDDRDQGNGDVEALMGRLALCIYVNVT
eukprot:TRINITY_DN2734_c0_g1_i1.p1 TRINITY_DN2734_c0_g1~~TRINITY_DN2734_c0_g1_i1.p1  ORF type:complete len:70 (+),score=8.47 TRINITY_DN2734_c0_g1_i1:202-411(+)